MPRARQHSGIHMNYERLAFSLRGETGATQSPSVALLLYPGVTLLDLVGPQAALAAAAKVHLVWKTLEPVRSDSGIEVSPTTTLDTCPEALDVLCVPGGPGQIGVLLDPEVMRFIADRGRKARFVSSVCTGSIILGAAGLLQGYQATSHWLAHSLLPLFGAIPLQSRVVVDRNRITAAGVTAGIDLGLILLERLVGRDAACLTQLAMEYDPEPVFKCGSPAAAGPEIARRVGKLLEPAALKTAEALKSRLAPQASEREC